ncbi:unnamed protein product [Moneuplotes crassus]|uniref:DUSP domain-containing protein n=1 Tax=Euplotes crassus TaxID=5936 RepID=A0AAD1U4Y7_EUPCR|nr:unnamed protein product [Moneuplotes crassus]
MSRATNKATPGPLCSKPYSLPKNSRLTKKMTIPISEGEALPSESQISQNACSEVSTISTQISCKAKTCSCKLSQRLISCSVMRLNKPLKMSEFSTRRRFDLNKHLNFSAAEENLEYDDVDNEGPGLIFHLVPQSQLEIEVPKRRSSRGAYPTLMRVPSKEIKPMKNQRYKSLQAVIPRGNNLNNNPFPKVFQRGTPLRGYDDNQAFCYLSTKTGSKSPRESPINLKLANLYASNLDSTIQVEDGPVKPVLTDIKKSYTRCICRIPAHRRDSDNFSCASSYRDQGCIEDPDEHEDSAHQLPKVSMLPSNLPCGKYCKRLTANEEKEYILREIQQFLRKKETKNDFYHKNEEDKHSADTVRDFIHSDKYAEENERKYIIDFTWWAKWTDYVNFSLELKLCDLENHISESQEFIDCKYEKPQKIRNYRLLSGLCGRSSVTRREDNGIPINHTSIQYVSDRYKSLKPNLVEGLDYCLVPACIWKYLINWYDTDFPIPKRVKVEDSLYDACT